MIFTAAVSFLLLQSLFVRCTNFPLFFEVAYEKRIKVLSPPSRKAMARLREAIELYTGACKNTENDRFKFTAAMSELQFILDGPKGSNGEDWYEVLCDRIDMYSLRSQFPKPTCSQRSLCNRLKNRFHALLPDENHVFKDVRILRSYLELIGDCEVLFEVYVLETTSRRPERYSLFSKGYITNIHHSASILIESVCDLEEERLQVVNMFKAFFEAKWPIINLQYHMKSRKLLPNGSRFVGTISTQQDSQLLVRQIQKMCSTPFTADSILQYYEQIPRSCIESLVEYMNACRCQVPSNSSLSVINTLLKVHLEKSLHLESIVRIVSIEQYLGISSYTEYLRKRDLLFSLFDNESLYEYEKLQIHVFGEKVLPKCKKISNVDILYEWLPSSLHLVLFAPNFRMIPAYFPNHFMAVKSPKSQLQALYSMCESQRVAEMIYFSIAQIVLSFDMSFQIESRESIPELPGDNVIFREVLPQLLIDVVGHADKSSIRSRMSIIRMLSFTTDTLSIYASMALSRDLYKFETDSIQDGNEAFLFFLYQNALITGNRICFNQSPNIRLSKRSFELQVKYLYRRRAEMMEIGVWTKSMQVMHEKYSPHIQSHIT